jgi:hypothetical protein
MNVRIMSLRSRIQTRRSSEAPTTIRCPKGRILAGCLLAALALGAADPRARAVPTRGELRLLAVRASFADRPLIEPPEHFAGTPESLLDRLAAYYAEVSTGRLRIVPYSRKRR